MGSKDGREEFLFISPCGRFRRHIGPDRATHRKINLKRNLPPKKNQRSFPLHESGGGSYDRKKFTNYVKIAYHIAKRIKKGMIL